MEVSKAMIKNVVIPCTYCIFFLFLLLIFSSVSLAAESTADVSADAQLKEKLRKEILGVTSDLKLDAEYIVGYRDIIHVSIYGEGSMAATENVDRPPAGVAEGLSDNFIRGRGSGIEVRLDGRISLRHIGDVSVVGMTLTQIADYLKKLYSSIYDNPSLTVTLVQSNSRQYTVMGQVTAPGQFHLDYPITIVQAIARAGGFTEWANFEITVIRSQPSDPKTAKNQSDQRTFEFDYEVFLKGKKIETNIQLRSGDVVVVH